MLRALPFVLLLFGCASTLSAQKAAEKPASPPPTVTTVRLAESGELEIFDYTTRREARIRSTTIEDRGERREVRETYVVEVPVLQIRRFPTTRATVYDLDGNKYEWEDVAKMLAKPTPVLLSRGPKEIDPFYRRLFQMGTLVVVLPDEPAADLIAPPPVSAPGRRR